HGHNGLRVAQVEHLVGDARLDIDEVPRLVLDRLLQSGAILVPYAALEDVEHHVEPYVNVRVGDAAGRDAGDVHREVSRGNVLRGESRAILDPVPRADAVTAADDPDAVPAFDVLFEIFVRIRHSLGSLSLVLQVRRPAQYASAEPG